MGQIVQYQLGNVKPREKTLLWIDIKTSKKDDKTDDADGKENAPEQKKLPLAKLIPIKDTIDFSKRINTHHSKTQRDIQSCLRGTRLNKFQKQQAGAGSKSGPIAATANMSGSISGKEGETAGSSIPARKTTKTSSVNNSINQKEDAGDQKKPEKAKNSNRNKEAKESKNSDAAKQQLNFYQPSDGSSENLQSKSVEDDKINDSGEIIYQQNQKSGGTKDKERNPSNPDEVTNSKKQP